MVIGLALGGGAARGMAHLGVLEVLSSAGIKIDVVSGCSVGSVIGALCSAGLTLEQIQTEAAFVHWRQLIQRAKHKDKGLLNFDKLERLMTMMIGDIDFNELEIPFGAVAMDFDTGERVVCTKGSVARAVHASCAVPGLVEPVQLDGRRLVDGGVVDNLPVDLARELGADYVVAVDIVKPLYARESGVIGVGLSTFETLIHNSGGGIGRADFLICPDTAGMTYWRFSEREQLMEAGRQAAKEKIPELVESLAEIGATVESSNLAQEAG